MANSKYIFGGIEGGGTQSTISLLDQDGKVLITLGGPATNHWLSGMEECQNRIKNLVDKAKEAVGIPVSKPLQGLGLCLSGCEEEKSNQELESGIHQRFPEVSESIYVASDTIGSLTTGCSSGVILISGTGSNSLLMNPDGNTYTSGGWGYMIGDEGAGYWIANKGVKTIFDEDDNLADPPHPTDLLRKIVYEHFQIKNRFEMLEHLYRNFQKPYFASLTVKISKAAAEGDKMCCHLMSEGGWAMGRYLSAQSSNMDEELFKKENGLEVICAGSVFKSWDLMKEGFVKGTKPHGRKDKEIPKITLYKLKVPSAIGAAYQASKKFGYDLPKTYSENVTAFCTITKDGVSDDCSSGDS